MGNVGMGSPAGVGVGRGLRVGSDAKEGEGAPPGVTSTAEGPLVGPWSLVGDNEGATTGGTAINDGAGGGTGGDVTPSVGTGNK